MIRPLADAALGQWYAYDMRPSGTATFVKLQEEVCHSKTNPVHPNLVVYAPNCNQNNCITSALRLYTAFANSDKAEVGIGFYDRPFGLFNGMKFIDMVNDGITFDYNFFKATVTGPGPNLNAAPSIKIGLRSTTDPSKWASLVWEPYQGGCGNPGCVNLPPLDMWHAMHVDKTTGTSPINTGLNKGWWKTGTTPGQGSLGSLAAWATWFNTDSGYGPTFMNNAVIESVRIGVGTFNLGVTSYVDSLKIVSGDYDWKWTFESIAQCAVPII